MAKYETMMVTTANLDEEASNALINKFKNLIAANGTCLLYTSPAAAMSATRGRYFSLASCAQTKKVAGTCSLSRISRIGRVFLRCV